MKRTLTSCVVALAAAGTIASCQPSSHKTADTVEATQPTQQVEGQQQVTVSDSCKAGLAVAKQLAQPIDSDFDQIAQQLARGDQDPSALVGRLIATRGELTDALADCNF